MGPPSSSFHPGETDGSSPKNTLDRVHGSNLRVPWFVMGHERLIAGCAYLPSWYKAYTARIALVVHLSIPPLDPVTSSSREYLYVVLSGVEPF